MSEIPYKISLPSEKLNSDGGNTARYTKLFTLPERLYTSGSPVVIEAGALTKDNNTRRVFVQLKFRNIGDKTIKALSVTLKAFYSSGKEVNEPVKYQYLDFMCETNKEFGAKTPVPVSESTARSFAVHIDEVVYGDGTVENVNLDFSDSLPKQSLLNETDGWNFKTAVEFRKLTGSDGKLMLTDYKDLWLCSCGCVNRADKDEKCRSCGVAYDLLKSVTPEKAQERIDEAMYNEAAETMKNGDLSSYEESIVIFRLLGDYKDSDEKITECENQIQKITIKNKKNKKKAVIVGAVICAVIALVAVIENVIIPAAKYNNAVKLYEASEFDEAIDVFSNLDDYKDCADQINNCKYGKAMSYAKAGKYDEAISIFDKIKGYKDSADQIKDCKYNIAISYVNSGKYYEAISIFDQIKDYKDSTEQIYDKAMSYAKAGNYDEAISSFSKINSYKDSSDQIKNCKYEKANKLIEAKNYVDAYDILADLDDYKDCKDKAFSAKQEIIKNAKTGDTVIFGLYKQRKIEWLVLEKNNGRILVICKYVLDCKEYNTTHVENLTWEGCSLRKWLNDDFINSAFSGKEKALIREVTVSADKNPKYDVDSGNATQDKLFLLSIPEVNKYLPSDDERRYLLNGFVSSGYGKEWWLRTPGQIVKYGAYLSVKYASCVKSSGEIDEYGDHPDSKNGVRPAMWISISEE